mgnify:CR=1 FL=1
MHDVDIKPLWREFENLHLFRAQTYLKDDSVSFAMFRFVEDDVAKDIGRDLYFMQQLYQMLFLEAMAQQFYLAGELL